MNELRTIIFKVFGMTLNDEQITEVLKWYEKNYESINSSKILRSELGKFLFSIYKGKKIALFEEDTSNLEYLLMLLKKNIKSK